MAKVAAVAPEVQVVKVLQADQAVAPDSLGDVRKPDQVAVAATTTAPDSRGNNSGGGQRKRTGKRDLELSCRTADSNAGLEPTSCALLIKGDEVAAGHNIRSCC